MNFYFSLDNFLYMVGLIICSAIHLRKSTPRKYFVIRLIIAVVICLSISLFIPKAEENSILTCLYMASIRFGQFLLILFGSMFLFKTERKYILTRSIFGNITLFVPYAIYIVIVICFNISESWIKYLILISCEVVSALIFAICSIGRDKGKYTISGSVSAAALTSLIVAAAIAFSISDFSKIDSNTIIVCFVPIVALLSYLLVNFCADERRIKAEYDFLKTLHHKEKMQYRMSKELIDNINIKFHDIKHQIQGLKKDFSSNGNQLLEIEKNIANYENFIKTGNDSLDVIMTEKKLYCDEKKIDFDFEINAQPLSIIKETDIYSLFGNMLDNAIESALKTVEGGKFIKLTISNRCGAIYIHCENSYNGKIIFRNGLPTTNKNTLYHGFGTKSICNIVNHYDGTVNFKAKDNVFSVDIVFPLVSLD